MALIRGKNWWWNYFKDEFFSIFENIKGYVLVANGCSEIEVNLDPSIKIGRVFVAVQSENIPVCGANVDMVGSTLTGPSSFMIYADIKSNSAIVYWLVDYSLDGQNTEPIDI